MDLATSEAGTYSTMAPEVRNQSQGHKCSADMFSLGVLLIQLLIGHLPPANFYEAYVYRSEFKGKISQEIDRILISLLDHNPYRRPSAADLLTRLASWK
jgi:serine/threonine protein kinase